MKLIITRHGETEENKNRIIQGHLDGSLSELGIEQAKKLAQRLKEEKIDKIFSSNLARASNTAKEISRFHEDTPLELVGELRERYLGILEGEKVPVELRPKILWDSEFAKKVQAETPEELFERAKTFLHKILDGNKGKTVLFVAHNGINQALITYLLGKSPQEMRDLESLKNTSVSVFNFDEEGNPIQELFNCTKHLE